MELGNPVAAWRRLAYGGRLDITITDALTAIFLVLLQGILAKVTKKDTRQTRRSVWCVAGCKK